MLDFREVGVEKGREAGKKMQTRHWAGKFPAQNREKKNRKRARGKGEKVRRNFCRSNERPQRKASPCGRTKLKKLHVDTRKKSQRLKKERRKTI